MKLQRVFQTSALVPALFALVACGGSDPDLPTGTGGFVGVGGASIGGAVANGGSTGGTVTGKGGSSTTGGAVGKGGAVGNGGSSSGGAVANGGAATGGSLGTGGGLGKGGSLGKGGGSTGGSLGKGGASTGGNATGAGGSSVGGSAPGGGTATGGSVATGGTPGAAVEDEGANCTIGTLPDSGALTANAKLPDPFKKLDGTRIAAKSEWRCRRQEIKKLAEKFAFGTKPPKATVTGTVSNSSITVNVSDGGKSTSFTASVSLPTTGSAPYPAVVVLGGFGADTNTIKAAGAAVINYDPYKVGSESTGRASKSGAFYTLYGSNSTTGLLVAWGWGVSRIIDVIEQDGKVLRADGIGVTGCSRFGKGAFVIGAFDQRIALTMPIESGTAGVPIWRNVNQEGAQTLSSAYGETYWFGDAFSAFTGSPTKNPIDTHEVIAMVAPRGLFIMDNPHITNLGPKSAHIAAQAGVEVYKALGAGDNFTYWSDIADGGHCAVRPEWKDPMTKNIQKHLLKTGSFTGVIKAASKASASVADWKDWTTPTLN